MVEKWIPSKYIFKDGTVIDYTGLYEISNNCVVRSIPREGTRSGEVREIKIYRDKQGYPYTGLCKNGVLKFLKLHRLGLSSFFSDGWFKGACVNHKDENKENNFIFINEDGTVDLEKSNLEWCTFKYNIRYGTARERKGEKLHNGKKSKPVLQFDLDGNFIKEWPSMMEIQRQLGYSCSFICRCCRGKAKTAYGFIWKYK